MKDILIRHIVKLHLWDILRRTKFTKESIRKQKSASTSFSKCMKRKLRILPITTAVSKQKNNWEYWKQSIRKVKNGQESLSDLSLEGLFLRKFKFTNGIGIDPNNCQKSLWRKFRKTSSHKWSFTLTKQAFNLTRTSLISIWLHQWVTTENLLKSFEPP